jgi:multidrug efflux system outer membrane protein
MKKSLVIPIAIGTISALIACRVGPDFKAPETVKSKATYSQRDSSETDSLSRIKWFEVYKDEALNKLIQNAIDSNRNLLTAVANVEEARLNAAIQKADFYPQFNYGLGARASSFGSNAPAGIAGMNAANYNARIGMNWEIDLFGKIRSSKLAAVNQYMAAEEIRKNVQVSLVAEVASNYFRLRDLDNQLLIAQRTLEGRKELFRIINERFTKGYISEVDKLQAEQQLAIAEAMIPNIKRRIVEVENTLNILCGRFSGTIVRGSTNYEQQLPPGIPVGLPSELLERRPDIKAAEYTVAAQYNQIGVAQANRFPSLSLTAAFGLISPQVSTIVSSNSLYGTGLAGLTGPLFEFNKNKNRVEVQRQKAEAATRKYEESVIRAFSEVETSLNQITQLNEEYEAYKKQVLITEKAYNLSKMRYTTGYTSYLEVLIQETALLQAQMQESTTLQLRHNAVVNLYKALGGGW